jgi:hypothetical protein
MTRQARNIYWTCRNITTENIHSLKVSKQYTGWNLVLIKIPKVSFIYVSKILKYFCQLNC